MRFLKFYLFLPHSWALYSLNAYSSELESYLDLLSNAALRQSSTCTRRALGELLPDCSTLSKGDSTLRVKYAIDLSICEFQASGINYPEECDRSPSSTICSQALALQPVWWTTFSNSYQAISTICLEYKTDHQENELLKKYAEYFGTQLNMTRKLEKSFDLLDKKNSQAVRISQEFERFFRRFEEYSDSVWISLMKLQNTTENSSNGLEKAHRSRENELQNLMLLYNSQYLELSQEMRDISNAHQSDMSFILQSLESEVECMLTSLTSKTQLIGQNLEALKNISNDTLTSISQLNSKSMSLQQSYFSILNRVVSTGDALHQALMFMLAILAISFQRILYLPICAVFVYRGNYLLSSLLVLSARSWLKLMDHILIDFKQVSQNGRSQQAANCYFLDY